MVRVRKLSAEAVPVNQPAVLRALYRNIGQHSSVVYFLSFTPVLGQECTARSGACSSAGVSKRVRKLFTCARAYHLMYVSVRVRLYIFECRN